MIGEERDEVEKAGCNYVVRDEVWINKKESEREEETAKHLLWKFWLRYRVLVYGEKSEDNINPVRVRFLTANS